MPIAIWWIKRDFRLADNAALTAAIEAAATSHATLLPLYLEEPIVTEAPDWSDFHHQAVLRARTALSQDLSGLAAEADGAGARGAELLHVRGDAVRIFDTLHASVGVSGVFAHEETGPLHTFERDKDVRGWARENRVPFREFPTNGVIRGLPDRDTRIGIFHARMAEEILPPPDRIPQDAATLVAVRKALGEYLVDPSSDLTTADVHDGHTHELSGGPFSPDIAAGWSPGSIIQPVSEASAQNTLRSFLNSRVEHYSRDISAVERATQSCSRLSIHLAWGTITTRQVLSALTTRREELSDDKSEQAKAMRKGLNAFRSRIYWHDHFVQRLEDEPDMELHPLNRAMEDLPYVDSDELFQAWYHGRTGFPMVDASMRFFHATGWLNFRMRAMVVSFACHVLHLSWQRILWPMAGLMADYVPGIHLSQTQMQAGVIGINTIRIYSPMKQLRDHDPDCTFVRRWVPGLEGIDEALILKHDSDPVPGYLPPIVDYSERASQMRSALWRVKKSDFGRAESQRVLEKHGSRKRGGARRSRASTT